MTSYRLLAASTLIYLLTLSHLALRSFAGDLPERAARDPVEPDRLLAKLRHETTSLRHVDSTEPGAVRDVNGSGSTPTSQVRIEELG
jgi:hypothetical protein